MTQQEQKVLEIIKTRIGITDDSKDALIQTYVKEMERRILHYCQRSNIPDDLNWVWASMVIDTLKVELPEQFGGGEAESIKIGDTSVGPAKSSGVTSTSKTVIEQVVLNYKSDLHRYRKLRW